MKETNREDHGPKTNQSATGEENMSTDIVFKAPQIVMKQTQKQMTIERR
jgi:hypothetical protein